eukprot:9484471-Pyramimonas_sp.AAC.1
MTEGGGAVQARVAQLAGRGAPVRDQVRAEPQQPGGEGGVQAPLQGGEEHPVNRGAVPAGAGGERPGLQSRGGHQPLVHAVVGGGRVRRREGPRGDRVQAQGHRGSDRGGGGHVRAGIYCSNDWSSVRIYSCFLCVIGPGEPIKERPTIFAQARALTRTLSPC